MAKRWGQSVSATRSVVCGRFSSTDTISSCSTGRWPSARSRSPAANHAKHRREGGQKLFTADEVRRLIDAASPKLRAMIYLGINCAFGNHDCGSLPLSALDLERG